MTITDDIYGAFTVEGVISEIILSAPFQRLNGIHQGGAIFLIDPSQNHTRFDHSLGVYHLVTRFGGSLEERVAALLHDISHTAFSHVGDYIFDHVNEDYHETIFDQVISRSEIPLILQKHGLEVALQNLSIYTILDQPSPHLCADRIDYTLRDLYQAGIIDIDEINQFLANVTLRENRLVLSSEDSINWFTSSYKRLNKEYFQRPEYLFVNQKMGELLKLCITKKELETKDLMETDNQVIEKLQELGYGNALRNILQLDHLEEFNHEDAANKLKDRKISLNP